MAEQAAEPGLAMNLAGLLGRVRRWDDGRRKRFVPHRLMQNILAIQNRSGLGIREGMMMKRTTPWIVEGRRSF